jgi:hypothetical protein
MTCNYMLTLHGNDDSKVTGNLPCPLSKYLAVSLLQPNAYRGVFRCVFRVVMAAHMGTRVHIATQKHPNDKVPPMVGKGPSSNTGHCLGLEPTSTYPRRPVSLSQILGAFIEPTTSAAIWRRPPENVCHSPQKRLTCAHLGPSRVAHGISRHCCRRHCAWELLTYRVHA